MRWIREVLRDLVRISICCSRRSGSSAITWIQARDGLFQGAKSLARCDCGRVSRTTRFLKSPEMSGKTRTEHGYCVRSVAVCEPNSDRFRCSASKIARQSDVIGVVGRTPLIKLRAASEATGCTILGKAEFMNPGGSVKDRAALAIISDAAARGALRSGGVVVEGTAGNTGIGIAMVTSALGYRAVIVIPDTQSQEKKDMLRLAGAASSFLGLGETIAKKGLFRAFYTDRGEARRDPGRDRGAGKGSSSASFARFRSGTSSGATKFGHSTARPPNMRSTI